jgi:heptosyltransferase-2
MPGAPDAPRRIFVRAPNWVGDVLMATPALRALRLAHPGAHIVLAGRPAIADLIRGLPSVDRFLSDPGRGSRALIAYTQRLRESCFDWAVLFPDSVRAALGPFLARIPIRAGYARDVLRRALITHALEPPRVNRRRVPISMVERYLRITRALGCRDAGIRLDLVVDAAARSRLQTRLQKEGVGDGEAILVVTPGASFGDSKLWPVEHFAKACDELVYQRGLRIVLAPGPGEEGIAREVAERMRARAVNLTDPPTTLAELAALVERARLVLTNDTGPRHVAVALERPVVSLLGPTDPRHTDHLLERQRVLREAVDCSPCGWKFCPIDHRCMTRLRPERVVRAALELVE